MYLLDTNILIWVLRKNKTFVDLYHSLKHETLVSISTLTVAEIYKNVLPNEAIDTEELLNDFKIWDVTSSIAKRGGIYWQQYYPKLENLNILDCLIAATAREHDLSLVSLNSRHFPMDDIKVLDPVKN